MHEPVLVKEVIELLKPVPGGVYVDCTVGYGGHSLALLNISSSIKVYAIDADKEALEKTRTRLNSEFPSLDGRVKFLWSNFKLLGSIVPEKADGIIFDLGLSSNQLDEPGRGFSHRFDSLLDMRFDREAGLPCFKLIEKLSVKDIEFILTEYGEEYLSRRIARHIAEKRPKTTKELHDIIAQVTPWRGRGRALSRVFQAFRIFINDELNNLREGLVSANNLLKIGGRVCVISYHSLEDRIVKQYFRGSDGLKEITCRPIIPEESEIISNRRSRSAKLRCAERVDICKVNKYTFRGEGRYGSTGRNTRRNWRKESKFKEHSREVQFYSDKPISSEQTI